MTACHHTIDSPIGPLTLVADGRRAARDPLPERAARRRRRTGRTTRPIAVLVEAARQLGEYFDGDAHGVRPAARSASARRSSWTRGGA